MHSPEPSASLEQVGIDLAAALSTLEMLDETLLVALLTQVMDVLDQRLRR